MAQRSLHESRVSAVARPLLGHATVRATVFRVVIPGAVFVLFACTDDDHDQFRSDVLDCEEAVAHLEACCGPGFSVARDACHYGFDHTTGCDSWTDTTITPGLDSVQSACVRERSCDELLSSKVCDRAQGLTSWTNVRGGENSSSGTSYNPPGTTQYSRVSVCP